MKIGLFFGSFNPMHIGHKVIASYLVYFTDLDKVMFVVSPQNPHKQKISLLDQYHRLQIIRAEIEDNSKLEVSDIEFSMPQPSYTIDTLVRLKEDLPENFQRSEYVQECGFVDLIVERKDLQEKIGSLLSILLKKNSDIISEISNEITENTEPIRKEAS